MRSKGNRRKGLVKKALRVFSKTWVGRLQKVVGLAITFFFELLSKNALLVISLSLRDCSDFLVRGGGGPFREKCA